MRKILFLAASCLLMTSCVIDKRDLLSAEEKYNESFVEMFGKTDPEHTWMMVDNKTVEVSLDKPSRVKVYVKFGNNYKLAADYENVSGNRELHFDAPMGCEDVYVTVDGIPYQEGASAGSRTFIPTDEGKDVISQNENDYRVYTYCQLETFKNDNKTLPERVDNTQKVTMDYIAMAEEGKSYTFYPLFWNGDYFHTFGLYYLIGNQKYEFDFYKDKEGDCLQVKNSSGNWDDVTIDYVFEVLNNPNFKKEDDVLRSKPYTITFPEGTGEFGFYVKIYGSSESETEIAKYYSNPAYNVLPNTNTPSFSSFAYLELKDETSGNVNTYITIEDKNQGDLDYNDFIFVMEGTQEHIEEKPVEYIYAVEDLGGTDDFDFNDVVFSVSHVAGQPHANVKLLAAGGTLPANICFGNTSYGEVHDMFGVPTTEMVNTAKGTTKGNMKKAVSFQVNVGTTWSHKDLDYTENFDPKDGFNVKVNNSVVTIYKPGVNAAPQILVLTPNWLWPTERTRISDAYSGFGYWGEDYTKSDWVNTRDYSKVIDWVGTSQTN